MIVQSTEEEAQACLSLHDRLQTYLDEADAYDRVATIEYVSEDVLDHLIEEDAEVIQLAPAAFDHTPPKVKDPIEKVNNGQ